MKTISRKTKFNRILVKALSPQVVDANNSDYPAISILKPLRGAEAGISENLESFFQLTYPNFEIIFSVADENDPVVEHVKRLIPLYPHIQAKLLIGACTKGANPKVNNLVQSYAEAKHDFILISDSNVRVQEDYLHSMIPFLFRPELGVVTAIVAGIEPKGLGGILEAATLNTFCARGMGMAFAGGMPFVVGKSMLFSRKTAERFGGLRVLGKFLAEDYMAGEAMSQLGLKIFLLDQPVEQYIGKYSMQQFWKRHIRWGRIRKSQAPLIFPFEILQNAILSAGIGALSVPQIFAISWCQVFVFHMLFCLFCDLILMTTLDRRVSILQLPFHWLLRELVAIPLQLQIAFDNTVEWRGQKLRLGIGGVLEK